MYNLLKILLTVEHKKKKKKRAERRDSNSSLCLKFLPCPANPFLSLSVSVNVAFKHMTLTMFPHGSFA